MNPCSECRGKKGNRKCYRCNGAGYVNDDGSLLSQATILSMLSDSSPDSHDHSSSHSGHSNSHSTDPGSVSSGGDGGGGGGGGE